MNQNFTAPDFIDVDLPEFLQLLPGILWELEVMDGEPGHFTRRYGEFDPALHQIVLVGQQISEALPRGHAILANLRRGIQSKQPFSYIEGTRTGRFYHNRCRPVFDELGQVVRIVGMSIDMTESLEDCMSQLSRARWQSEQASASPTQLAANRSLADLDLASVDLSQSCYMVYQPIVDLRQTNSTNLPISGAEALIRLKINDTDILPSDFLPYLELVGRSAELSQWIIPQTCRDIRQVVQKQPDFFVAMNLRVPDLLLPNLVQLLQESITENQLQGKNLHLEIVETVGLLSAEQYATVEQVLYQIRILGIRIGVDDFGTQNSNFDRLRFLVVDDFMKIDRSFMPQEYSGCETSVCMAMSWISKTFQLRLIAEGIEELAQLMLMRAIGCDYGQGYYFHRPMLLEDLKALITKAELQNE
ncbi:MAG: EAL domain-containing protein [Pegethrix bostrychoides GSE-TBD4-15B]|jgi:EAL domain-containing protein (putative c-di-GMP-specific phosphodiesterase class I)|uniref:EAL domain-containing protein n=1 Tax=Pegethrix bostrychoides GSE-TBD4-15B TaxID=2839662 RepID=A0A951PBF9_9CYAN|nr:EAL domain-containing protein [Pegethrix bostrychoides GSE-TBD4-15B]